MRSVVLKLPFPILNSIKQFSSKKKILTDEPDLKGKSCTKNPTL